jgi:MraZ protein
MLIGQYSHTIDGKKRVSLPSKIRKEIGKNIILTRGLDNCIFVYSEKEWEKASKDMSDLSYGQASSRGFNRFLLSGAVDVEIDSAGRVLIPDHLKEFARLNVNVVIVGLRNRLEIWDEKRWKDYTKKIERDADTLAERLGEMGLI